VELILAGQLDIEDEVTGATTDDWIAIWRRIEVPKPAAWSLLVRFRRGEMADRMELVRSGHWDRDQYLAWRAGALRLIGSSGMPTEQQTQPGSVATPGTPKTETAPSPDDASPTQGCWRRDHIPDHIWRDHELDRQIGFGGTGQVYLVHHRLTKAAFAVKIMRPDLSESFVKNELTALERIRSKHVVTLRRYEPAATPSGQRWMVFYDYVPGPTLLEFRTSRPNKRIDDPKVIQQILLGIASGLADLHHGKVVHRDLKPANIIIRSDGNGGLPEPVIIDLGMAGGPGAPGMTVLGGTPGYQSPEQEAGERCCSRTDIYTFGLVAYELVTGRRLAGGKLAKLHEECPGLPPQIDALIKAHCANEQLSDRLADGQELLRQLLRIFAPRAPTNQAAGAASAAYRGAPPKNPDTPRAKSPAPASVDTDPQIEHAIASARKAAEAGKIDDARATLSEVQRLDPRRVLEAARGLTESEIEKVRRRSGGTTSTSETNHLLRILEQLIPFDPNANLPAFLDILEHKLGEQGARRGIEAIRPHLDGLAQHIHGRAIAFLHAAIGELEGKNLPSDAEKELAWSAEAILARGGHGIRPDVRRDATIQLARCLATGRGVKMNLERALDLFQSSEANAEGQGLAALAAFLRENPSAPARGITRAEAAIRAHKRGCVQGTREHGLVLLERWSQSRDGETLQEACSALMHAFRAGDMTASRALRRHLEAGRPLPLAARDRDELHQKMPDMRVPGNPDPGAAGPSSYRSSAAASAGKTAPPGGTGGTLTDWDRAKTESDALRSTSGPGDYQAGLIRLRDMSARGNRCARMFLLMEVVHLFAEGKACFGPTRRGQTARILAEVVVGSSGGEIESLIKDSLGRAVDREVEQLAQSVGDNDAVSVRSFVEFLRGACNLGELARARDAKRSLQHFTRSWEILRSRYNARSLYYCFRRGVGTPPGFSTPLAREVERFVRDGD
jgi:serine/threonine protein kinase